MKEKPILFEKKSDCCGCGACFAICNKNAIKMLEDLEGFMYPHIDDDHCVKCYLCIRVCPIKARDFLAN